MYQHLGFPMYRPKVIIPEDQQSEYKLMLYKQVLKLCENNEPVNPFKSFYEEHDALRIALNVTNDLPGAIKHWDEEVSTGLYNYVILGDPDPSGYSEKVLQNVLKECSNKNSYLINEDWFIALINIDDTNKLVVKESRITVE